MVGIASSSTSNVIAIENTPSLNASTRPLSEIRRGRSSVMRGPTGSGRDDARREDVELVKGAVGIQAVAVRVVGPCRMEQAAIEREAGVVSVVGPVVGIMGVRSPGADPHVRGERPPVAAE